MRPRRSHQNPCSCSSPTTFRETLHLDDHPATRGEEIHAEEESQLPPAIFPQICLPDRKTRQSLILDLSTSLRLHEASEREVLGR